MKPKIIYADDFVEDPSNGDPEYGIIKASQQGSNMKRFNENRAIIAHLNLEYEVISHNDLFLVTQQQFEQSICLITNLPRNPGRVTLAMRDYSGTAQFLTSLRQKAKTPIAAYSGAPREILRGFIDEKIADYAIPRGRYGLEIELEYLCTFIKSLTDKNVKPVQIYLGEK